MSAALGVTRRQLDTLDFIRSYIAKHEVSPSFDEIRIALGLRSKSGVYRLVHALAERGHITIRSDRARSIAIGPDYQGMLRELAYRVISGEAQSAERYAHRALSSMRAQ